MTTVTSNDEGLLLALLNSTPTVAGARTDMLADTDGATAWLRDHADTSSDQELPALRAARDTLQAIVRGDDTPAALSGLLAGVGYRAVAAPDGITWDLVAPQGRLLTTRAVLAWDALTQTAPGRLRPCANTQGCSLFLIDHSRSNSARWCSMAQCGNRMKARRHYERRRITD